MDRASLDALETDELKQFAAEVGIVVGDESERADVVEAIVELAANDPAPVSAVQGFKPDAPVPDVYPTVTEVHNALQSFVARGLQIVTLTDSYWHLRKGNREAAGNLKMPLAQLVMQAKILLQPTKSPTEQ